MSPYDICECGDYRSDHEGGTGASRFPAEPLAKPCLRFRLEIASKARARA